MKRSRLLLIFVVALSVAFLAGASVAFANPLARPQAAPVPPAVPPVVSYQGQVQVGGGPYSGMGNFKLAIVDALGTTTYWSNDGTSTGGNPPGTAVALPVDDGLFTVLLGDTSITNMTEPLTATVFSNPNRFLRVWFSPNSFSTFTQLTPDRRIAAVPYALQAQQAQSALDADRLGGVPASAFQQDYQHVIVVAKAGGDYDTITAALAAIADNDPSSRYLIWVAPGTYNEKVAMKPYVDIEGAGEPATTISAAGGWSRSEAATVIGANYAELRSLTVENTGNANNAIGIYNSGASPHLTHVTVYAHDVAPIFGGCTIIGVCNEDSSSPQMTDVTVTASGGPSSFGSNGYGVYNYSSSPTMASIEATASGATYGNVGVYNYSSSPEMRDVTATATGGTGTCGVYNGFASSPNMLSVTAAASGATGGNYGVHNQSASPQMRDVIATATGGTDSYGVFNTNASSPSMCSVTATASGASANNSGVRNEAAGPMTMLRVSATASGGNTATAIQNESTTVTMTQVTASATGYGGYSAGVYNYGSTVTVLGSSIEALGTATNRYGLELSGTGTLRVIGSQIAGATYSLVGNMAHTIYVGASQLSGPVYAGSATFHCTGNYDASYSSYTCP